MHANVMENMKCWLPFYELFHPNFLIKVLDFTPQFDFTDTICKMKLTFTATRSLVEIFSSL